MRTITACRKLAALLAASALASGCMPRAADTPPPRFASVPDNFAAGTVPGEIRQEWWREFGDPRLDAMVERALANNPTIAQSAARLRQARALARIEDADLYPEIGASLRAEERGVGGPPSIPARFDLSVDVAWEADLWGRISAQSAAAAADARASAAELQDIRQLIAAETARTYLAVIEAKAQVDLSTRVLSTYDELTRQLALRVDAGVTPRSLSALATTDQETARAGLEARREDYQRLLRRLEILTGDYPGGDEAVAAMLPAVPALPPTGVPAQLLERRPDVRAAAARIAAAGYRVDAAEASFLPNLVLTGSAGTSASSFADLFDSSFGIWSLAGRLLQPVFQGGRLRAQLDFREGERDEALEAYAETALQALFETESALAVDGNLAAREAAFDRSASAAEEATRISTLRYRAGIESFFNVLESQQRALFARSAYLSARRARLANRIDLHLALGGGLSENNGETATATAGNKW